jgi:hypothetical protein
LTVEVLSTAVYVGEKLKPDTELPIPKNIVLRRRGGVKPTERKSTRREGSIERGNDKKDKHDNMP